MAPSWETFVDIECQSEQLHRATPTGYFLQLWMLPGQSNALDLPPTAAKLLAESEQSSWFVHLLMDFNHQAVTSLSATAIETRQLLHLRQLQRGLFRCWSVTDQSTERGQLTNCAQYPRPIVSAPWGWDVDQGLQARQVL